jgi:hypothetical protein
MTPKIQNKYYISGPEWNQNTKLKIRKSFKKIGIIYKKEAAIGEGAEGCLPDIHLLTLLSTVILSGISGGFLGAIGEDMWLELKKSIKKLRKVRPEKVSRDVPKEFQVKEANIIWWVQFYDKQILINLPSRKHEKFDEALDSLPFEIDKAQKKNPEFTRIYWTGKRWEII